MNVLWESHSKASMGVEIENRTVNGTKPLLKPPARTLMAKGENSLLMTFNKSIRGLQEEIIYHRMNACFVECKIFGLEFLRTFSIYALVMVFS